MHVCKALLSCKSICDVKSGIDPYVFWHRHETNGGSYIIEKKKRLSNCKEAFDPKNKCFRVRCTLKHFAQTCKIYSKIVTLRWLAVSLILLTLNRPERRWKRKLKILFVYGNRTDNWRKGLFVSIFMQFGRWAVGETKDAEQSLRWTVETCWSRVPTKNERTPF